MQALQNLIAVQMHSIKSHKLILPQVNHSVAILEGTQLCLPYNYKRTNTTQKESSQETLCSEGTDGLHRGLVDRLHAKVFIEIGRVCSSQRRGFTKKQVLSRIYKDWTVSVSAFCLPWVDDNVNNCKRWICAETYTYVHMIVTISSA